MSLRELPAVHRFLAEGTLAPFAGVLGPAAVRSAVGEVLAEARRAAQDGAGAVPSFEELSELVRARLERGERAGLVDVLNATGVLLHTNLGRAPLAREALDAIAALAAGYSNLEYDLDAGERGSRYERVGALLREATGAEDALLVNNCAAGVLLALDTFAKGREALVARGELIEIGGGFRLPDVLARSGATLVEVGTTNKVYLRDFERGLTPRSALAMRTHPSNFRIEGFAAEVPPAELAAFARRAGIASLEDLGSGALLDLRAYGLPHERTVQEAVRDGFDLVAFSGDKLLGGPQCGVLAGRTAAIARLRANPLLRALRVDKATLAALAATVRLYLEPNGVTHIPLYAMLGMPLAELRARAERVRAGVVVSARAGVSLEVRDLQGAVGGGTLPQAAVPSAGLTLAAPRVDDLARALRLGRPAIAGRVEDGRLLLDLRTVPPERDSELARALAAALG